MTDRGRTVSYGYDGSGKRTQMTWPDGVVVSYHYGDASRLVAIREGAHTAPGSFLASYQYGALNLLASQALGDGGAAGTSTYAYFSDSTLRKATHDLSGDADDVRFNMTYWPSNRLRSSALSNDAYQYQPVVGSSETFTANGLNQLTSASFGGAPANLNYDPNGNLTTEGTTATYGYDAENRLTSAQTGGTTVAFGYDPEDRRSSKTVGGTETLYLYDGAEIIADLAADGTILRRYVYALGVDQPIAMYTGSGTAQRAFYVTDPQGSVIALADTAGAVPERHSYSPFGRPDTAAIGASGNPLRYASLRWDPEIALYNMRARVYDPELRRFLQTDPIGYGDGPNVYAYVGNDPVNFGDPSGMGAEALAQSTVRLVQDYAGGAAFNDALQSARMGNYGIATVQTAQSLGEAALAVFTLGEGAAIAGTLRAGRKAISRTADDFFESARSLDTVADGGIIFVDKKGNAMIGPKGGGVTGSPDGRFIQVRDARGKQTGTRIDGGHNPYEHHDPRAQGPHGHVPGVTNADGTPWLPIR